MDYTATIDVDTSPAIAARSIYDDLEKWWSTRIDRHDTGFTVRFNNSHVTFARAPGAGPRGFSWTCTDAHMIIEGVSDYSEWTGTQLIWSLKPHGNGTRIRLTHQGLNPGLECNEVCSFGWQRFFEGSLRAHLNGQPADPETSTVQANLLS